MTTRHRAGALLTAAVMTAAGWGGAALARADAPRAQESVTLTGCLRVGSASTVFLLRGATWPDVDENPGVDEGQMPRDYLLVAIPDSLDLGSHLNHLVAVTGVVSDARSGPPPPESANTAERALRRLAVGSLREVAPNCG